jgi:hypothetical protein
VVLGDRERAHYGIDALVRWPKIKRPSPGYLALAAMNVFALLLGGTAFMVQAGIINPVTYGAVSTAVCNYYNSGSNTISFGCPGLNPSNTGSQNTAFGSAPLSSNTTGAGNTAIGYGTLNANTTGGDNTAIGGAALTVNTTGNNSTAVGYAALQHEAALGNNSLSTAVGYKALQNITTGGDNTALGNQAGAYYTGGSPNTITTTTNSIFIGGNAYASADADTYETVIGVNAVGLGSNTALIGASGAITKVYTYGGFCPGTASTTVGNACLYSGTGAPTLSAANGSMYMRYDGGTGARVYVNTSGASSSGTTWTALSAP